MPRNGSGSYVLPEPAFIPGTAISSAAVNSDFSDIGDALTGSLARDGQGGMTAVLPLANTGFTYLTDPNTGMRRTAADTQAISGGGVDVVTVTSTGVSVAGTLDVSGAILNGGNPIWPIGFGPVPWSFLTAPPKWIFARGQTLLRADFPAFWTLIAADIAAGNTLYTNGDGSTTFTVPDLTGRIPAGREAVATRLTSAFFGGNSTILGAAGGLQSNNVILTHNHGITDPGHIHSVSYQAGTTTTAGVIPYAGSVNAGTLFGTIGSSGTNITINNAGSASAHNIVQPTIITNYIIYAGA